MKILRGKYILSDEIIFESKPDAVPYNYRISYKIGQLCLIFAMCCGRSGCSLFKLHMISTSLYTNKEMKRLREFSENRISTYSIIRFDPATNRAVKYALADKLIFQQANGLFRLTKKGREFVKLIKKDESIMINEKSFLASLSDKLTEGKIKGLMTIWRYADDSN